MKTRTRKILGIVAVVVGAIIIVSVASALAGTHSSSPGTSAGPKLRPQYYCWGADSYGNVALQADTTKSEADCLNWMASVGLVIHAGTVPGGVAQQGIACIATDASKDPWAITVTNNASSNSCQLLASQGYAELP